MSEREEMVLSDKQVIPTDEYIYSIIGDNKLLWQEIMKYASENCKDISGGWNYYNDGKQWLFKLVSRKKTIFWGGILKDTFRISFWFPDRAVTFIDNSDLPEAVKIDFRTAKKYGATRGVSIKVLNHSDVDIVRKLIDIKQKIK